VGLVVTRYTMLGGRTTGETVLPWTVTRSSVTATKASIGREKYEGERRQKDRVGRTITCACRITVDPRGPEAF